MSKLLLDIQKSKKEQPKQGLIYVVDYFHRLRLTKLAGFFPPAKQVREIFENTHAQWHDGKRRGREDVAR